MTRAFLLTALVLAGAAPAGAWPQELMQALNRDARRLLPKSLSRLLAEREADVLAEIQRFPPRLGQAMARDLQAGWPAATQQEQHDPHRRPPFHLFQPAISLFIKINNY